MKIRIKNTKENIGLTEKMGYDYIISKSGKTAEIYVSENEFPYLRGDRKKIKRAMGF